MNTSLESVVANNVDTEQDSEVPFTEETSGATVGETVTNDSGVTTTTTVTPGDGDKKDKVVQVVSVSNPTKEEMEALLNDVKVNYDFNVNVKPAVFNFRKTVDKESGIETQRKPVELAVPYPSVEGILAILEAGGVQLELLIDAIEKEVNSVVRDMLYEDLSLTAATFPVDKVSWAAIAAQPRSQRRGRGIAKEVWEGFAEDYIEIMPGVTGKETPQIANAAKLLLNKMAQVKTNEPVLNLLVSQLTIYAENSPNIEEYQECVEFLLARAENYLNLSEEDLLANL